MDSAITTTTPPRTDPIADDVADRRTRARILIAEGYDQDRSGRHREAIASYTTLIDSV